MADDYDRNALINALLGPPDPRRAALRLAVENQRVNPNYAEVRPLTPENKFWLDVLGDIPKDPINDEGRRLALGFMGGVRPLSIRAYHGMAGPLEGGRFDPARFGRNHPDDKAGVFLTTNPETASGWANWAAHPMPNRPALGPAVVPVDANFKNPLRVSSGNRDPSLHWYDSKDELLEAARRGGHDGVIVQSENPLRPEATLVAVKPGTVHSATTGDVLYSGLGLPLPPQKPESQ